jgi:HEAT repeat protein
VTILSTHGDEADVDLAAFDDVIESAVPDIIEALKDNDSDVRQAAMDAIGELAERGR